MATQVQFRGDPWADLIQAIPVAREIGVDTTNWNIILGDNMRNGGIPHVNYRHDQNQRFRFATHATGSDPDDILLQLIEPLDTLLPGTAVEFIVAGNNTGAVTIKVDATATVDAQKFDDGGSKVDLNADDLKTGMIMRIVFDGSDWQIGGGGLGGGGSLKKVATIAVSGTNVVSFNNTHFTNTGAANYLISYRDARMAGADSITFQGSQNNGSVWQTTYYVQSYYRTSGTTSTLQNGGPASSITVGYGIGAGTGVYSMNGEILLKNMGSTGRFQIDKFWNSFVDSGGTVFFAEGTGGFPTNDNAFDAVRLVGGSNFSKGTFTLFEIEY